MTDHPLMPADWTPDCLEGLESWERSIGDSWVSAKRVGNHYVCAVDGVWIEGCFATAEAAHFWSQQSPDRLADYWRASCPVALKIPPGEGLDQ